MKPLFKNYNYEFSPTEKKVLSTFCKQVLRQIQGDPKFLTEERAYQSILNKLASNENVVKLTKDESKRLELQLNENLKMISEKMKKAWFIKKWMYKSLQTQYQSIINNHFKGYK